MQAFTGQNEELVLWRDVREPTPFPATMRCGLSRIAFLRKIWLSLNRSDRGEFL
jgi:hypothetical protein